MFLSDLNEIASHKITGSRNILNRLTVGLSYQGQDDAEPWLRRPPEHKLDMFDEARLHPAASNLRSAILVLGGVPTGENGLAQECRPANGI